MNEIKSLGMGGHQSTRMMKDEWLTPPEIIKALGSFDLDPCSPIVRPWETAIRHFTIDDDGLAQEWSGRVWCNPPYGRETVKWLSRCADHKNAIALVFARTETSAWVEQIWKRAHSILFIYGRLEFYHVSGIRATSNSGAPSALISYDENNSEALKNSGISGYIVKIGN